MMKTWLRIPALYFILLGLAIPAFTIAQQTHFSKIFQIDGIIFTQTTDLSYAVLFEDEIANMQIFTNKQELKNAGLGYTDTLVRITTKAYNARPDSLKIIPSQLTLKAKNGKLYKDTTGSPYTGPFINYFINGKKEATGFISDGLMNGQAQLYYPDGHLKELRYYKNGKQDSTSEEYFRDGTLKEKGQYKDGMKEGEWQSWYSTGESKFTLTFLHSSAVMDGPEFEFYELFNKGLDQLNNKKYGAAIRQFKQANDLRNDYDEIFFYRGLCYRMQENYDDALADLNEALNIEPENVDALVQKVFVGLTALGNYRKNNYKKSIVDELQTNICKDIRKLIDHGLFSVEIALHTTAACTGRKFIVVEPY